MLKNKKFTCGIIGYPLKKPRSIPIWKKFFKKKNINASMIKFEIKNSKFNNFIKDIRFSNSFLAMAVTMPYKQKILNYLDKTDSFAKKTKSVNLVVKKKKKLIGYNTDIFGAVETIKKKLKIYDLIIIIGLGGTGTAIYNYLSKTYNKKKFILVSKKNKKNFEFKNTSVIKKIANNLLMQKALIINCTPLGSSLKKEFINKSPLSPKNFENLNKKSFIFDIVYSPKITMLNLLSKKNKISYTNGVYMNTVQAEKALKIVF